jgi:hypothetical protein
MPLTAKTSFVVISPFYGAINKYRTRHFLHRKKEKRLEFPTSLKRRPLLRLKWEN